MSLKSAKDLQAIAMVARGLFELAVDMKLIDAVPDAVKKILAFSDVEKLRAARKIVKYKAANPAPPRWMPAFTMPSSPPRRKGSRWSATWSGAL